jgi:uncharacterized protein (PEP-CTERM system associated)
MSKNNQKLTYCILIFSLITLPKTLLAELQIIPSLELSEIYTDNVTFAAEGLEESDFITRLAPGILARIQGSNTYLQLDYRLEHLIYAEDDTRNSTFHQMQANMNSELVREYFFIDANAGIFQAIINAENPVFSNVQVTDNRTDVQTFGISPYLLFPISSFAQSELRYRYQELDYDDNTISDSTTKQIYFLVRSNQRSRRFSWRMVYNNESLNYDLSNDDLTDEDTSLELNYRTTPTFALLGTAGYEDIEYTFSGTTTSQADSYWNLGFVWDFTPRTSLELRRGERFYGDTYYGAVSGRSRFSTWALTYSEDLTTAADQQLETQVFEQAGDADASGSVQGAGGVQGIASITTEPFIEKRLDFNYSYSKRANGFFITAYHVEREFQISNNIEKVDGTEGRLDWNMLPRTILSLLGSYENLRSQQTNGEVITRQYGLRATRQISNSTSGYLEYGYNEIEDVLLSRTAQENIVEATLVITF